VHPGALQRNQSEKKMMLKGNFNSPGSGEDFIEREHQFN
jgi:hypothetical protein